MLSLRFGTTYFAMSNNLKHHFLVFSLKLVCVLVFMCEKSWHWQISCKLLESSPNYRFSLSFNKLVSVVNHPEGCVGYSS
jgi:hypothetical protein